MSPKKKQPNKLDELLKEASEREKSYRERALKMYPHICARCGREFSGIRLKELTVHHIDHDHDNNPPDGSNWELLCMYCHENEHNRYLKKDWYEESSGAVEEQRTTYKPFANLADLLNNEEGG